VEDAKVALIVRWVAIEVKELVHTEKLHIPVLVRLRCVEHRRQESRLLSFARRVLRGGSGLYAILGDVDRVLLATESIHHFSSKAYKRK